MAARLTEDDHRDVMGVEARKSTAATEHEFRIEVVAADVPGSLRCRRVDQIRVERDPHQRRTGHRIGA
jgi:hypothetical protein